MAKCPKCGAHLRWYEFRAECKHCGVNIPNYNWEKRLNDDADTAETAFAKLHYKLKNFKYGTIGSPVMVIRLIMSLLPLVALVVPLVKVKFSMPFYEENQTVSFLTFILNYLVKFNIKSTFSLLGGDILGPAMTMLIVAAIFALLAVVCGVVNFFAVLIASLNLNSKINIALNFFSTAFWGASMFFAYRFTAVSAQSTLTFFKGTLSPLFALGIVLFAANIIINVVVAGKFKTQKENQPSLDEAIKIELRELREMDKKPITE